MSQPLRADRRGVAETARWGGGYAARRVDRFGAILMARAERDVRPLDVIVRELRPLLDGATH